MLWKQEGIYQRSSTEQRQAEADKDGDTCTHPGHSVPSPGQQGPSLSGKPRGIDCSTSARQRCQTSKTKYKITSKNRRQTWKSTEVKSDIDYKDQAEPFLLCHNQQTPWGAASQRAQQDSPFPLGPSSSSFLCSHTCWGPSTAQAELCLPTSASRLLPTSHPGLTLYRLSGSSSPRPAESLSPSHTPARQTQTISLGFPWLPRGKRRGYKSSLTGWRGEAGVAEVQLCCPTKAHQWQGRACPGENFILLWKQSSGRTTRGKREGKKSRKGGSAFTSLSSCPSYLKGFGFLSKCQWGNKATGGSRG